MFVAPVSQLRKRVKTTKLPLGVFALDEALFFRVVRKTVPQEGVYSNASATNAFSVHKIASKRA